MTFDDILAQILALLKRQGRVSYRLDDAYLADLIGKITFWQK